MPLRLFSNCQRSYRLVSKAHFGGRNTLLAVIVAVNSENQVFDKIHVSGDDRARTDNLRLARAALSQLSYVPINYICSIQIGFEQLFWTWRFASSANGRGRTRTSDLSFIRAAI